MHATQCRSEERTSHVNAAAPAGPGKNLDTDPARQVRPLRLRHRQLQPRGSDPAISYAKNFVKHHIFMLATITEARIVGRSQCRIELRRHQNECGTLGLWLRNTDSCCGG
jgi:hypothetical protein